VDFFWKIKNKGKGLAEFKMPQLAENTKWDGKDVEVAQEGIDDDFLNDIIGNKGDSAGTQSKTDL